MCQLCETGGMGDAGFGIVSRSAEVLVGLSWEGSFAEARSGSIRTLLSQVQARLGEVSDLWASPIVGISWNDRPDGFRYFVGVPVSEAGALSHFDARIELPATICAAAWHAADDGDVIAHYGRMIEWISASGHMRNTAAYHHREEYPRDADFDAAPELRLMIPVR